MISGYLVLTLLAAPQAIDDGIVAARTRKLLAELVAADTENPPGNEARAVAIGVRRLKAAGIPCEVTSFSPGRENLVARLKGDGSQKPLLLLAHVDVVGTAHQDWSSPPHQMTERAGTLIGRGVEDDLGMAALNLELLVAMKESGRALHRDVIVAWTGDEESGGAGIRWLLAHRPDSLAAEVAFNEGGGPLLMPTQTDGADAGSAQRMGVRLLDLQTAEKIYQDFTLRTQGTTGHASVPLPDNAIARLGGALARIAAYRFPAHLLPVTRAYLTGRAEVESAQIAAAMRAVASSSGPLPAGPLAVLEARPALAALLRTTCVPTLVSGGTRVNSLPAAAEGNVNCRIMPDESVDEVRRALMGAVGDSAVSIEASGDFGFSQPTPLDGSAPAAVEAAGKAMWPDARLVPVMSLGADDSRFLRQVGVRAYGFNPIPVSEEDSRRAHGIDERIPADSLRSGAEVLRRIVERLAE
jgi:acetylornithine deacetylase/succinyl-diaminopimelate desuccinylase-like protein